MRVRTVLARRDVRTVVGGKAAGGELVLDPAHQLVLGERRAAAHARSCARERLLRDACDDLGRATMRLELRLRPHGEESRDQIGGGHDGRARGTHHLDHAGGNPVDHGNRVAGRILHRRLLAAHEAGDLRLERLPRGIDTTFPRRGPVRPRSGLDRVRDRDRRAVARDPREHAPRRETFSAEQRLRDRIDAAEVVEQPSIDVRFRQGGLHRGERFRRQHCERSSVPLARR